MIVLGTRGSDLALWQTRWVAERLRELTGEECRVEIFTTKGDQILDKSLPSIGGKGLFTAELEQALFEERIDVAVHSMKDLPVENPEGLTVGAVPARAAVNDVLVYDPVMEDATQAYVPLAVGCRVGTSSHRRRSALCSKRPDFEFADVRGNVPTRIDKVRRGDYGAIVLASAGIDRLGLDLGELRRFALPSELSTPAPAQGALAVQCRVADARVRGLLDALNHEPTARSAHAERDVLYRLGGGCSMPLGALVTPCEAGHRLQVALFANPEVVDSPRRAVRIDEVGDSLAPMVERAASMLKPLVGDPLAGLVVTLLRPDGEGGALAAALEVAGATVDAVALTRTEPIEPPAELAELVTGRAVCLTSARGVERFAAATRGLDLSSVPMFAGGPATAAVAAEYGWDCAAPVEGAGGRALAELVLDTKAPPRGVLFPCAEQRHTDFEAALAEAGVAVHPCPLYRTVVVRDVRLVEAVDAWLVFTSPSAVRAYAALGASGKSRHLALGPSTAAAMEQHGVRLDAVAAEPTAPALIRSFLEFSDV